VVFGVREVVRGSYNQWMQAWRGFSLNAARGLWSNAYNHARTR